MKKFLAMILACVSVAAFAGCGGTTGGSSTGGESTGGGNTGVTVDTEVTADEFAAAFNFGTNYACVATLTYEGQGIEYWGWYRAGDLLKSTTEAKAMDGSTVEGEYLTENFVEKDGETVYYYSPTYAEGGVLQFFRKEVGERAFEDYEYEELNAMLPEQMQSISAYIYNAEENAYEAAEIVVSTSMSAKNVSMKFVDNKLVSGAYIMSMSYGDQSMEIPVAFTVTYGGVTITLPTNLGS